MAANVERAHHRDAREGDRELSAGPSLGDRGWRTPKCTDKNPVGTLPVRVGRGCRGGGTVSQCTDTGPRLQGTYQIEWVGEGKTHKASVGPRGKPGGRPSEKVAREGDSTPRRTYGGEKYPAPSWSRETKRGVEEPGHLSC